MKALNAKRINKRINQVSHVQKDKTQGLKQLDLLVSPYACSCFNATERWRQMSKVFVNISHNRTVRLAI